MVFNFDGGFRAQGALPQWAGPAPTLEASELSFRMPGLLAASIGLVGLSQASNVWERAWATQTDTIVSPDACLRLDGFEPFWMLPSVFQQLPEADARPSGRYGSAWESPRFYRLYEISSGRLLGESEVFDLLDSSEANWGKWSKGERRRVFVRGHEVARTLHCTDDASRQAMERYFQNIARSYGNI